MFPHLSVDEYKNVVQRILYSFIQMKRDRLRFYNPENGHFSAYHNYTTNLEDSTLESLLPFSSGWDWRVEIQITQVLFSQLKQYGRCHFQLSKGWVKVSVSQVFYGLKLLWFYSVSCFCFKLYSVPSKSDYLGAGHRNVYFTKLCGCF